MLLSGATMSSQYVIEDGSLDVQTAAFGYCMVPDYIPSLEPSASTSASPSPVAESAAPEQQNSSSDPIATSSLLIVVAAGVGGLLLIGCLVAMLVIRSRRIRKKKQAQIELPARPGNEPQQEEAEDQAPYLPIGFSHVFRAPTTPEKGSADSIYLEGRQFTTSSWSIPFKDIKMEKEVGRGGFGVVYKGRWQGIQVAVKHLVLDGHDDEDSQIQQFFAEAELMMKLKGHPNITQILGICFEPKCLVTEFVDNGSLRTWLSSNQPMDDTMKIRIARDIAAGMLYLHREGVIHRDLAARNILLDSKMRAKVSDFGMSRIVLDHSDVNKTGANVGPVRWMAPEAMRQRLYNKKTDIWSFGVVLYEIMTRKIPYYNEDVIFIATRVTLGELSLIPEVEKDQHLYPNRLVKIIKMCLNHSAQDRPVFDDVIEIFDEFSQEYKS